MGVTYERKVHKALLTTTAELGATLEYQPWFNFTDTAGNADCVPDFLIHHDNTVLVVETKLTWVSEAAPKLMKLYVPVVMAALGTSAVRGLIIAKTLMPSTSNMISVLKDALRPGGIPTLQWLGHGPIRWQ